MRENLTFSALMRLPHTMSTRNKSMRVEQVIGQVSYSLKCGFALLLFMYYLVPNRRGGLKNFQDLINVTHLRQSNIAKSIA